MDELSAMLNAAIKIAPDALPMLDELDAVLAIAKMNERTVARRYHLHARACMSSNSLSQSSPARSFCFHANTVVLPSRLQVSFNGLYAD